VFKKLIIVELVKKLESEQYTIVLLSAYRKTAESKPYHYTLFLFNTF
jgi:hypothetical protein